MSVIVDDADRSIAYEDAWTVPNPQSLGAASYSGINQSIGGTLHGARVTNPSNVSLLSIPSLVYKFNGEHWEVPWIVLNILTYYMLT